MAEAQKKKVKLIKGRHASAIKRHRQSVKRAVANQTMLGALKTITKRVRQAITKKDKAGAKQALELAMKAFYRAASSGVIHRRNASRHVSRLSQHVSQLG